MKKLKLLFVLICSGVFMLGCASSHEFSVQESWTQAPKLVKVLFNEPDVESLDNLKYAMPENFDRFDDWFKERFLLSMKEKTDDKVSFDMGKTDEFAGEVVPLRYASFKAPKPVEMTDDADVYLAMDKIWFGYHKGGSAYLETTYKASSPSGDGAEVVYHSGSFKAQCKYAFYDARTKKILAYGKADVEGRDLTRENWESMVSSLVDNILEGTPLAVLQGKSK